MHIHQPLQRLEIQYLCCDCEKTILIFHICIRSNLIIRKCWAMVQRPKQAWVKGDEIGLPTRPILFRQFHPYCPFALSCILELPMIHLAQVKSKFIQLNDSWGQGTSNRTTWPNIHMPIGPHAQLEHLMLSLQYPPGVRRFNILEGTIIAFLTI